MDLRGPRSRSGFTLVELMVVIAIVGMLAAVVTVNVMRQVVTAKKARVKVDMRSVTAAIKLHKTNTGRYPDALSDLWERPNGVRGWNGPYLDREFRPPKDPWGFEYQYESSASSYKVWTDGADNAPGGEEEAADWDDT